MAFEDQLDHLLHPHLFYVAPQPRLLTLAELGAAVSRAFPGQRTLAYGLSVAPDLSYSVSVRSGTVFVNQYTGEILGMRSAPTFLNNVHQLHLRLLAGAAGKRIVSWAAVVMLFLLLSGVYLWWPFKRVTIAWRAPARRIWFDVHSTIGILVVLFLLVLTVTGIVIGFEEETTPLFYRITRSRPADTDFKTAPRTTTAAR